MNLRWLKSIALVLIAAAMVSAKDGKPLLQVGKADEGRLPAGWSSAKTGTGEGSVWKVVADDTTPSKAGYVLAQTAQGPSSLFNICVADNARYKDVELRVSFKAIAGKIDQGGGFVWRYQDSNNYYVCRVNPLENNYRVYKVSNGKRSTQFQDETIHVPLNEWHLMKVKMKGDRIECFLDDKKVLDVQDSSITEAGKVGLWTKADAQTRFDNLTVTGE